MFLNEGINFYMKRLKFHNFMADYDSDTGGNKTGNKVR